MLIPAPRTRRSLRFGQRQQLFAAKLDAAMNAGLRRQQAQDGQRADRFSRPRFPNQSQYLAGSDVKADIADSRHHPLSGNEFDAQVADVQQRGHTGMLAG